MQKELLFGELGSDVSSTLTGNTHKTLSRLAALELGAFNDLTFGVKLGVFKVGGFRVQ